MENNMNLLRRTIRKLLLENQDHFDKLAELICSEDIVSINQGFGYAEAIDAVQRVEYTQRSHDRHPHLITHNWTITGGYEPAFLESLKNIIFSATWGSRPTSTYLRSTTDTFVLSLKEDTNRPKNRGQ